MLGLSLSSRRRLFPASGVAVGDGLLQIADSPAERFQFRRIPRSAFVQLGGDFEARASFGFAIRAERGDLSAESLQLRPSLLIRSRIRATDGGGHIRFGVRGVGRLVLKPPHGALSGINV
jgi:hypothetical protein